MSPSFVVVLSLTVIGALVGAPFDYPAFGAICGFALGLGLIWELGK